VRSPSSSEIRGFFESRGTPQAAFERSKQKEACSTKSFQSDARLHTFVQRMASQGLKLGEVVHQVAVLVLGVRGHVVQLPDVALPDAQGEDLNAAFPQRRRHRPRVAAVGVAVGDQENGPGGVGAGVTQYLLSEKKTSSH